MQNRKAQALFERVQKQYWARFLHGTSIKSTHQLYLAETRSQNIGFGLPVSPIVSVQNQVFLRFSNFEHGRVVLNQV